MLYGNNCQRRVLPPQCPIIGSSFTPETAMGHCRYCGHRAGWFRSSHPQCAATYRQGLAQEDCVGPAGAGGLSGLRSSPASITSRSRAAVVLKPTNIPLWAAARPKPGSAEVTAAFFAHREDLFPALDLPAPIYCSYKRCRPHMAGFHPQHPSISSALSVPSAI